jgi:hypothetical protein
MHFTVPAIGMVLWWERLAPGGVHSLKSGTFNPRDRVKCTVFVIDQPHYLLFVHCFLAHSTANATHPDWSTINDLTAINAHHNGKLLVLIHSTVERGLPRLRGQILNPSRPSTSGKPLIWTRLNLPGACSTLGSPPALQSKHHKKSTFTCIQVTFQSKKGAFVLCDVTFKQVKIDVSWCKGIVLSQGWVVLYLHAAFVPYKATWQSSMGETQGRITPSMGVPIHTPTTFLECLRCVLTQSKCWPTRSSQLFFIFCLANLTKVTWPKNT